ncbi:MAG: 3'-5' exoribonuclease [Patescibacteria group bacterium]|nr:3'-5' exoribonuclease [Patescibacteria group bacterium]
MEKKLQPFSQDIVFFDAEFTGHDLANDQLMSIGMVSLDGEREMYFELEYGKAHVSEWVRENVVPYLTQEKISREDARCRIREFCGKSEPHLVATVNQYDMAFWHKLFNGEEEPIHPIPIDFASMLFAIGLNPARDIDGEKKNFFASIGVDIEKYQIHNALDDARLMREAYIILTQEK